MSCSIKSQQHNLVKGLLLSVHVVVLNTFSVTVCSHPVSVYKTVSKNSIIYLHKEPEVEIYRHDIFYITLILPSQSCNLVNLKSGITKKNTIIKRF